MPNEKRENFKFCQRTTNNIQALLDMGLARNKTEAIDFALEHIVTEERTKAMMKASNAPTATLTENFASLFQNPAPLAL